MQIVAPTIKQVNIEFAHRKFWEFLKLSDSDFFTEEKEHLKELAQVLQDFYEGKLLNKYGVPFRILILNLPPRTGKSYTLTRFCQWVLGMDNKSQIATVSYNINMAGDFSRYVRDGIREEAVEQDQLVYNDIFPDSVIKDGDASAFKWALESSFFSYMGTGFNGTLTGKGFKLGIIDDPIKNAEEAYNERVLEGHYNFYKNTFRSRIEKNGLQIINHTRWSTKDLAGRLIEDHGDKIYIHKRQMESKDGVLLCPSMVDREEWEDLQEIIDPDIISANYQQKPIDIEGGLYKGFETYENAPEFKAIGSYTDTADTGKDFLCSIVYGIGLADDLPYLLDVIYDDRAMEFTEPLTAKQFSDFAVNKAMIESNNGGRGFARQVKSLLKEKYPQCKTVVDWFTQSSNKEARIYANSFWCQTNIKMPLGWGKKWPEFHKALMTYSKEGKNIHDDAPDALTGIAEQFAVKKKKFKVIG